MNNMTCNGRKKHLKGNTLFRNWEETSQSVQEPELHLSDLQPVQEDGRRHGQKIGENHVLLSKGDPLVREGSSGKLDGSSVNGEKGPMAGGRKCSPQANTG